jgi:hypothetical protein
MTGDRQDSLKWIWGLGGLALAVAIFHFYNGRETAVTPESTAEQRSMVTTPDAGGGTAQTMPDSARVSPPSSSMQESHPGELIRAAAEIDQIFTMSGQGSPNSEAVYQLIETMLLLAPSEQDNLFFAASVKFPQHGNEIRILWAFDHMLNGNCARAVGELREVPEPSDAFWKDIMQQVQGCNNGSRTG